MAMFINFFNREPSCRILFLFEENFKIKVLKKRFFVEMNFMDMTILEPGFTILLLNHQITRPMR